MSTKNVYSGISIDIMSVTILFSVTLFILKIFVWMSSLARPRVWPLSSRNTKKSEIGKQCMPPSDQSWSFKNIPYLILLIVPRARFFFQFCVDGPKLQNRIFWSFVWIIKYDEKMRNHRFPGDGIINYG